LRRRRFGGAVAAAGPGIPIAAVYGYSISATIRDPFNAPRSAGDGRRYKVAITPAWATAWAWRGSAEIGGYPMKKQAASIETLYKCCTMVSRRGPTCQHRRRRPGMERRAAHDADGSADDRRHGIPGHLDEPRPWLQRLGPGLLGSARVDGGPDGGP
jgi:hypothetical protein